MVIIVVLEEVPFAVLFFLFRSTRGQKSPLLGENYYCAGEKKIKSLQCTNLRSLLFLSFSLSFFLKTLWDKKREKNTKGERRKARNERGRYRVLFLTYLIAVKRLSARRLALVPFFNQNYRRQRWNRERYVVDVINIISSRYFHATQSFRVVTYRALRRVQL